MRTFFSKDRHAKQEGKHASQQPGHPSGGFQGFQRPWKASRHDVIMTASRPNDKLGRCLSFKLHRSVVAREFCRWWCRVVKCMGRRPSYEDPATLRPHRAILLDRGLWRSPGCLCSRPGCTAGRFPEFIPKVCETTKPLACDM